MRQKPPAEPTSIRLPSACSTSCLGGATETLVVRARALNYFHISGVLRPSDLVGESCLGLGAMIWGIEHVGLPRRGWLFARAPA